MTIRTLDRLPVSHKTIQDDAWSSTFRPPPNESADERKERLARQQEANRISREIDEGIERSKKLFERRKKAIKVLLLGQGESGKSTMLRNFQLAFCPTYFTDEIPIWKTIIQLNIIGSVKKLLAIIEDELDAQASRSPTRSPRSPLQSEDLNQDTEDPPLTQAHSALRLRVLPLLSVESNLARQLLPEWGSGVSPQTSPSDSGAGWAKWASRGTNDSALLKRRGVRMEDSAGFFLNDIMRIGKPGWKPAVDDIVRARLRTFGVEEHKFLMENGSEWYIYDVGGSRNMRPQWVPYFDDVQAIIFLAPLVFNQVLDEDRMVNRLVRRLHLLWKEVCSNQLLARANVILFLNKMDILQSTLGAGIRVATYVPSYGAQPNEVESVVKYFREKFRAYHVHVCYCACLCPLRRACTPADHVLQDTQATQAVLLGVREGILRSHLEKLNVL
ncbi:guanine nucleotide binding protein, alpha subunit [Melanogaster broomeanus]|nr:guanine nucleotide binding protein, alpha subunit [Melanogaster broomeanus]